MITPSLPIQRPEWNKKLVDDSQIPELLDRIASLRQKNITGDAVVFDYVKRRIQPLQAQETLGFEYQGTSDPSRYLQEEISNGEVFSEVRRLLKDVKHMTVIPESFSAANPPNQVWVKVVELY